MGTMTMSGSSIDPMSGQEITMINVTHMPDDDTMVFGMHMGDASAPAMMTITYTRK